MVQEKTGEVGATIKITDCLDQFICADALEQMRKLPSESIDLVVTSPPYNLKNSTGNGMKCGNGGKWANAALIKGYSHHDDNMPYDQYCEWQKACLHEMFRLIKKNGAIFYNHKWRVQTGVIQDRREIVSDFPIRQIIIWRRKGGINFNKGYFLPTYEVIYMLCKPDFVLAKGANSHGDVWDIAQEMNNSHPAPFPVDLIERIIGSTEAQLILDPFMGSGTVAVVAKKLGRHFIGIELSPDYVKLSRVRLTESTGDCPDSSGVEVDRQLSLL